MVLRWRLQAIQDGRSHRQRMGGLIRRGALVPVTQTIQSIAYLPTPDDAGDRQRNTRRQEKHLPSKRVRDFAALRRWGAQGRVHWVAVCGV